MNLPKTPSLHLDGKRALVTGAGRGIGLAAAAALAQAGAHVVLIARTESEIEQAAAQMREDGGSAEGLVLDVTDLAAMRQAIDAHAPFDVLVNNAGTNRPAQQGNRISKLSQDPCQEGVAPSGSPELFGQRALGALLANQVECHVA
jgi:NAD(P)-dependent dehydrogenase (short-subunit alcohol dehydrogenase family)